MPASQLKLEDIRRMAVRYIT